MHEYRSNIFVRSRDDHLVREWATNKNTGQSTMVIPSFPISRRRHKSGSVTQRFWCWNWPRHSTMPPLGHRWVLPSRRCVWVYLHAFRNLPHWLWRKGHPRLENVLKAPPRGKMTWRPAFYVLNFSFYCWHSRHFKKRSHDGFENADERERAKQKQHNNTISPHNDRTTVFGDALMPFVRKFSSCSSYLQYIEWSWKKG